MQHHKYSLTELENMMPWEREVYMGLLIEHLREEKERLAREESSRKYDYRSSSRTRRTT